MYLPETVPDLEKESCHFAMPVAWFLANPNGVLHDGIITTLMDISMGHLVAKSAGLGATIEMNVQFMRPVVGEEVTAVGSFTRRGWRISFMESHLYGAEGRLAAHATATWKMPDL
ncbi:MAG: PaaI family thioesterase [Pseudomonadota bacterium]